jgi:phage terminase large subunit
MWEIPSPFEGKKEVSMFWLPNKSRVTLIGGDDPSKIHGAPSDFSFFNECIDIDEDIFKQATQRCNRFWWMDYNPKATEHWIYSKVIPRPDVGFFRSTFKDNPYLSKAIVNDIMAYDPGNPDNVRNGTADDYYWKVYGLGLRSAPEGLVFKKVAYVDAFPEDMDYITYGMDFGETNQTAIVKAGLRVQGDKLDLFAQCLFYEPTETSGIIVKVLKAIGLDKHIWCDNNQPGWIADLRNNAIMALATSKFPGSREYWISCIKRCNIHIVRDAANHFKKEAENFRYRIVDGVQLSETIKKHDHLWSALGYAVVGDFRQYIRVAIPSDLKDH